MKNSRFAASGNLQVRKRHSTQSFSVVGGQFRGAKLISPDDVQTHPMGAREKNALFNRLVSTIEGAKILDAYAGSGALAIEALSRGAESVTLVEKSAKIAGIARQNLEQVAPSGNWQVTINTIMNFADETDEVFDIIIADPPYNKIDLDEIGSLTKILKSGGTFVLSHPSKISAPELGGLKVLSSKKYGGAAITIYNKIS